MCATCLSTDWDVLAASGNGTVYSYAIVEHPKVPGFDYPLPVVLVELDEGTRLISNLIDVEPNEIEIGMRVTAEFVRFDDDLTLPQFRRA